jgi:hypothetical protein
VKNTGYEAHHYAIFSTIRQKQQQQQQQQQTLVEKQHKELWRQNPLY